LKTNLLIINPWLKSACITALLFSTLVLTACTPPFNWRDVRFDEQKIAVTFPGKPDTITRTIDLAGTKLPMTMHGVRVKDLSYTVAWVKLPEVTSAPAVLAAMQLGMLRNVGAAAIDGTAVKTMPIISEIQAQLTDVSGKAISFVRAKQVLVIPSKLNATSNADTSPSLQMSAVFANHAGHAFQVVAVGSVEQFRQSAEAMESAKVFLESIRFIQ
jgi:hypothetical protein